MKPIAENPYRSPAFSSVKTGRGASSSVFWALLLVTFASSCALHAAFIEANWPVLIGPETAPCWSSDAPFGDCDAPLRGIGLHVPAALFALLGALGCPMLIVATRAAAVWSRRLALVVIALGASATTALSVGWVLSNDWFVAGIVASTIVLFSSALASCAALVGGRPRRVSLVQLVASSSACYLLVLDFILHFD